MWQRVFAVFLAGSVSIVCAQSHLDVIKVSFEANPDLQESECNPVVSYEAAGYASRLGIQTTYLLDGQTHVRSITLKGSDGVLRAKATVSGFSAEEASCAQLPLELVDIKCADPETFMLASCDAAIVPSGEDMFAAFTSRLPIAEL